MPWPGRKLTTTTQPLPNDCAVVSEIEKRKREKRRSTNLRQMSPRPSLRSICRPSCCRRFFFVDDWRLSLRPSCPPRRLLQLRRAPPLFIPKEKEFAIFQEWPCFHSLRAALGLRNRLADDFGNRTVVTQGGGRRRRCEEGPIVRPRSSSAHCDGGGHERGGQAWESGASSVSSRGKGRPTHERRALSSRERGRICPTADC